MNYQPPVITALVAVALILASALMVVKLSENTKCFDAFGITHGCSASK